MSLSVACVVHSLGLGGLIQVRTLSIQGIKPATFVFCD